MQTLIFNTTTKHVTLYDGNPLDSKILRQLSDVRTVKVSEGFYEVMQKDEFEKTYPVLRVPISNTNMSIDR